MLTQEQREHFDSLDARVQLEYDYEQAGFDFEDIFKRVRETTKNGNVYMLAFDNPFGDKDVPDLQDIVDAKKLACESFNTLREVASDAADFSLDKQEYDDDFCNNMSDILSNLQWTEKAIEALQPYFVIPVEVYETCGYSQGDYAYVVLFDKDVTDKKRNEEVKQDIDHAFWDVPIYCRLAFGDGSDFLADSVDRYEYDKEKYAHGLAEQVKSEIPDIEAFEEYLLEIMPDEPTN